MFSARYVDTDVPRARWRTTANYRVLPSLQLGVEYNPEASEVVPLATWFLTTETEVRPALFLGTSSDRIGSPEGTQAYYLTVAKHIPVLRASPYASLNYSEWDGGLNFPFGVHVDLGRGFSVQPMYDGQRTHLIAAYGTDRWTAGVLWVWLESVGVAVSVGF